MMAPARADENSRLIARRLSSSASHTSHASKTTQLEFARSNSTLQAFLGGRQKSWMAGGSNTAPNQSRSDHSLLESTNGSLYRGSIAGTGHPNERTADPSSGNIVEPPSSIRQSSATTARNDSLSNSTSPQLPNSIETIHDSRRSVNQILPSPAPSESALLIASPVPTDEIIQLGSTATEIFDGSSGSYLQRGSTQSFSTTSDNIDPRNLANFASPLEVVENGLISPSLNYAETNTQDPNVRKRALNDVSEPEANKRRMQNSAQQFSPISQTQTTFPLVQPFSATGEPTLESQAPLNPQIARGTPSLKQYSSSIESYLIQHGAILEASVERPRLQMLGKACGEEDFFYLALHQAFCEFSLNAANVVDTMGVRIEILRVGFAILSQLLKDNTGLSVGRLKWFSSFPAPLSKLARFSQAYANAIGAVRHFLTRLAHEWETYRKICNRRDFPPLVDELVKCLGLTSPTLQRVVFTAIHRNLWGAVEDIYSKKREQLFLYNQSQHAKYLRQWNTANPVLPSTIEAENQELIKMYRILRDQQLAYIQGGIHNQFQQLLSSSNPQQGQSNGPQILPGSVVQRGTHSTFAQPQGVSQNSRRRMSDNLSTAQTYNSNLGSQAVEQTEMAMPYTSQAQSLSTSSIASNPSATQIAPRLAQAQFDRIAAKQPLQLDLQGALPYNQQISPQSPVVFHSPHQSPHIWQQHPNQFAQSQSMYQPSNFASYSMPTASPAQVITQTNPPPRGQPRPPITKPLLLVNKPFIPRKPQPLVNLAHPNPAALALHQAHLRSPRIIPIDAKFERSPLTMDVKSHAISTPRLYRRVKDLAFGPIMVPPKSDFLAFQVHLNRETIEKIPSVNEMQGGNPGIRYVKHGSLIFRLRCVSVHSSNENLAGLNWITSDMTWPENIAIEVNTRTTELRRKQVHGKDLPLDITKYLDEGVNEFKVGILRKKKEKDVNYVVAVEIVEFTSQEAILDMVTKHQVTSAQWTIDNIKESLKADKDDDEVAIVKTQITVNITDPYTSRIFEIPVRGKACKHRDCFDLDTFLQTRKRRAKRWDEKSMPQEPCLPDEWKCPLCGEDARPQSLRMDAFLADVRKNLAAKKDGLDARAIIIKEDGSWVPKSEDKEDKASITERGPTPPKIRRSMSIQVPPEVITIDD